MGRGKGGTLSQAYRSSPPQSWLFWLSSILSAVCSPQSSLHRLPNQPDLGPAVHCTAVHCTAVEEEPLEYNHKLTPIYYIPLMLLLSNNKVFPNLFLHAIASPSSYPSVGGWLGNVFVSDAIASSRLASLLFLCYCYY